MGELADLLSKNAPEPSDMGDGGGDDTQELGEAAMQAMFEAGKKGDYAEAFQQLCAAIQHAKAADMAPDGGEGDAEDTAGHKPGLLIAIGHKK